MRFDLWKLMSNPTVFAQQKAVNGFYRFIWQGKISQTRRHNQQLKLISLVLMFLTEETEFVSCVESWFHEMMKFIQVCVEEPVKN